MWKDNSSIQAKFLNKMIFIVFISIGLWVLIWIQGEYFTFKLESESIRTEYLQSQKLIIKTEVTSVVKKINTMREQAELKFEFVLKERVNEAFKIAKNIYEQNVDSKDLHEIKKMIKDVLRPIRFFDGRGYYFAVSMDGVEQLYPISPEFEGKNLINLQDSKGNFVIQDEIKKVKNSGEGFVKSYWSKPDKDIALQFSKITFVKYFKPLDWYFGTGDYLDDFVAQTQKEMLNHIVKLRFGKEGYFFGSTYQGDSLFSNGKITIGSNNIWNLTDPNGMKIIQEQRKAVENPEGGFVFYSWKKLNQQAPSPKISFVMSVPEWEWTLGAGVYLDTIEKTILSNKAVLNNEFKTTIIRSIVILAVLLFLVYFWSRSISNQIQKSVDTFLLFLEKASINAIDINPDAIQLKEFKDIAVSTNKMLEDRKQAEEKLQASEKKYRELSDSLPQVVFEIDETGKLLYVNQNAFDLFGYTKDEFDHGINITQVITPEDHDRAKKNMLHVLQGNNLGGMEYTALRRDNTTFPSVIHTSLVIHNEKPVGLRGLLIDVSKQKKMETDLKRQALAMDSSSDLIVITDTKGNIVYVNAAFEKTTGYSYEEAIGSNPSILQSGIHDKIFYTELWETISNGQVWSGCLINMKKSGEEYTEEASISPVFSHKGDIVNYVAVKRDITEKLKLESQLQQSLKMESIGTLAGGIAHDFNNILFPIIGHTEMMLEDIPENSEFRDSLNHIYTGAMRASELVKQILTFSRQDSNVLKLMKMQPIIKEALKLIRSTIPTTIEIKQNLETNCGVIKADPTQIHQIVMNLSTNAYHAMEDTGGELIVKLKEIELGDLDLINQDMTPGAYACLTITDSGKGMDKDLTQKIFDPFFTTKEKGKGTGMGLSVVHGIVESMNGAIQVYSEPAKGTEFNIYLPVVKSSSEKLEIHHMKKPIQGGIERILLVDDEDAVVTMEKLMLERLGYQVTSRTSSIDALEAFRANPNKFDLVITDMQMPNMSGDKLSVELARIRPDIPVLLCTGFSEVMSEEKAASLGINDFLLKPIVMKDLSQKIREVLDEN